MEGIEYFKKMASELNNPEIQLWKHAGKRVVGTVCSNIPDEPLSAAGFLSMRIRAPGIRDTSNADSHLHRMICSYNRAVLESLLRKELEFLDGIVSTDTCDHMHRLTGELRDKANVPVHYFSMYHALTPVAGEWFILEMEKMIQHIEKSYGIKISDEDLRRSISVHNQTRDLIARLNELRKKDPPPLSGGEYFQIVLAGMSIPREIFNEKLEAFLPELEGRISGEAGLPRLMVVGGGCDAPGFIDFIERDRARVVADGLCFGMRHYQGKIDEDTEDPLRAIADRYISRVACPSTTNSFDHNFPFLKKAISEWRINGVVCARLKFCDLWGGASKLIREELNTGDMGIPILNLEREYNTMESGQINTRVQAYLEMLSG